MNHLTNIIKGIIIGIATLIPGVSGGTMAIILGIYDDMIHSVSSLFKDFKKNTLFLLTLGLGGIIGIGLFSKIVNYSLDNFKFPMLYFFLGIVFGGLPVLYKKALKSDNSKNDWLYFSLGFLLILWMSTYNGTIVNLASSTGLWNFIFLVLAGIIIAIALILPGISTSFMLLALGLYDITLDAIENVKLVFLIPIILGILIGTIATTEILENLLTNKPRPTYMVILGFVLGSIIQIYPGLPSGLDIILSLVALILGYIIIRFMSEKYSD